MLYFYRPGFYFKKSPLPNSMEVRSVEGAMVQAKRRTNVKVIGDFRDCAIKPKEKKRPLNAALKFSHEFNFLNCKFGIKWSRINLLNLDNRQEFRRYEPY